MPRLLVYAAFMFAALRAAGGSADFTTASNRQTVQVSGAKILVGPQSSGSVSSASTALKSGAIQVTAGSGYHVDALSFQVSATGGQATAQVSVKDASTIHVAAVSGVVSVADGGGKVVAKMLPGQFADFKTNGRENDKDHDHGHDDRDHDGHHDRDCDDRSHGKPISPSRPVCRGNW